MTFSVGQGAVVVDASITLPFLAGDDEWLEKWHRWTDADVLLIAPIHYWVEVANALLRSARLPALAAATHLDRLALVGVETADRGLAGVIGAIELADKHRLTVYDASYLYLAIDLDGQLATRDQALARAAIAEGVEVIG